MILAGHDVTEPYLYRLLMDIKKGTLRSLQKKARVPVKESRLLMGVYDQVGLLKQGEV